MNLAIKGSRFLCFADTHLCVFSKDSASNSQKQPSASHDSPVITGELDPVPIPANGCFLSVLSCSWFVTQMLPESRLSCYPDVTQVLPEEKICNDIESFR